MIHAPSVLSPSSLLRSFVLLSLGILASFLPLRLHAGPPDTAPGKDTPSTALAEPDPLFHHGAFDLQLMSGAIFSVQARGTYDRPNFNYAPIVLRLGYMVNNVYGSGFSAATTR